MKNYKGEIKLNKLSVIIAISAGADEKNRICFSRRMNLIIFMILSRVSLVNNGL